MQWLYRLLLIKVSFWLPVLARVVPVLHTFVEGRKNTIAYLTRHRQLNKPLIWMHVSSYGEWQQGQPVWKKLHQKYPNHQFALSFFSASGYELVAPTMDHQNDLVCYLPLDGLGRSREFLQALQPKVALFVKYDIWPMMMQALEERGIKSLLFSAVFRIQQPYFRNYGGFFRHALNKLSHIEVQDQASWDLLTSIGISRISVSGDTRYDRVKETSLNIKNVDFVDVLAQGRPVVVLGSAWKEDMQLWKTAMDDAHMECLWVVAPHKIDSKHLDELLASVRQPVLKYSTWSAQGYPTQANHPVLVIDNFGLLGSLYQKSTVAYIGGGLKTGLHNTLEAAVYGVPLLIGPNYKKFREAQSLVDQGGAWVVSTPAQAHHALQTLLHQPETRAKMGITNAGMVEKHLGATEKIVRRLETLCTLAAN
ncbi:MAG: 3-deoxy-D-manno-octulosonic acid transferase [Flavobacteriaceae bacterium]